MRKYSIKASKAATLDASLDYLRKVIVAIQQIREGVSESEVCKKYGINKHSFRDLIFNEKLGYRGNYQSVQDNFYCPQKNRYIVMCFG